MATAQESKNNTSGQFGTLLRRKTEEQKEFNIEDYNYLLQKDRRMRFNNAQDPIYYVFNVIENRPIKTLAKEFVRDSIMDTIKFVSRVVG